MKKSHKIYAIVASFVVMFILAVTESIRGVLIPTFKLDFNVTDNQIGSLLLLATLAYVVGTFLAGQQSKKMNQKQIVMIGMTICAIGFFGTSFAAEFYQLVVGYIVLTIGIGYVVLGLNTIVPAIKVAYIAIIMNMLHFNYGMGSAITQRVAGFLITYGVNWRHIFWVFVGMYIFGIILYAFVEQPKKVVVEKHLEKIHGYEMPLIVLFCVGLGFYISAEVQTLNWFLNYMKEFYGYTANEASTYVSLFFAMIAVGRLLGGYILERIGYLKGVIIAIALALIVYLAGLMNEGFLILISLSGLFCSIVYPTTMLIMQRVFEHNAMRVVSIVSMAGSIINMFSGKLIGYLNDTIGVRLSYFTIPVSLGLCLVCYLIIHFEINKVENKRKELEGVTV